MPLVTTYTCRCGANGKHTIHDWESYDQPSRLPLGWVWFTDLTKAPIRTRPVCPSCRKQE